MQTSPIAVAPARAFSERLLAGHSSGEQRLHHVAMHVRETEVPPLGAVGQLRVIDAEDVHDRRVQIVDVHRIADDVVAEVVGLTVRVAGLDAAAGQPPGEAPAVMVAAEVRLELALRE